MRLVLLVSLVGGCATAHRNDQGEFSYSAAEPPGLTVLQESIAVAETAAKTPGQAVPIHIGASTRQGNVSVSVGGSLYGAGTGYALDARGMYQQQLNASDAAATAAWRAASAPPPVPPRPPTSTPGGATSHDVPCPQGTEAQRIACLEAAENTDIEFQKLVSQGFRDIDK